LQLYFEFSYSNNTPAIFNTRMLTPAWTDRSYVLCNHKCTEIT